MITGAASTAASLRALPSRAINELRRDRRAIEKALAAAIPDDLVDEIAIACTPDEAPDRLAQWADLTEEPLFYPPSIGIAPERVGDISHAILDVFGNQR